MNRRTLPTRRRSETVETQWDGHPIAVTLGFYDDGSIGEIFANVATGGAMQSSVADACVIISVALQHGVPASDLAKSLARVPAWVNGVETTAPASPIGAIAAAILVANAP